MIFTINEQGLNKTIKFLENYRKTFRDYTDFLEEEVEPELKDQFEKCFKTKGFRKWHQLAESTKKIKAAKGLSPDILVATGRYRKACIDLKGKTLSRNNLKIVSPVDYAQYSEFGRRPREVFKLVADRMRRKIRKLYREYNARQTR